MVIVNIFEVKAKLSEYLELAANGERVLICKRNRPVAELRAVEIARTEPRPIGLGQGKFAVPESFFEPLPEDLLDAFAVAEPESGASRVAEDGPAAPYGRRSKQKQRSR